MSGESLVPIASGETTKNVAVPLTRKDAEIHGLLLDVSTGDLPSTPVLATVTATDGLGRSVRACSLPDNSYHLAAAAGTWQITVEEDFESGYAPTPPLSVTLTSGQTLSDAHIELIPVSTVISGTVYEPDGTTPLGGATMTATGVSPFGGALEFATQTDAAGFYELVVREGTYTVTASLPLEELETREIGKPPPFQGLTVLAGLPFYGLYFIFRLPDVTISGTITFASSSGIPLLDHPATVIGDSSGGQRSRTEAPVNATNDGFTYSLPVFSGDTWHVQAQYNTDLAVYQSGISSDNVIPIGGPGINGVNLTINSQPFIVSFEASLAQTIVMPDGTQLTMPAGALMTSGTATLYISPIMDLSPLPGNESIGPGYQFVAIDTSSQKITSFNQNIELQFNYDDTNWPLEGIREHHLIPHYYSSLSESWVLGSSYVVETKNNLATLELTHF
jgi:hypothetical protein